MRANQERRVLAVPCVLTVLTVLTAAWVARCSAGLPVRNLPVADAALRAPPDDADRVAADL